MKQRIVFVVCVFLSLSLIGCRKSLETAEYQGSDAASIEEMVPEEDASLTFWTADKEYGEAIAKAFEEKYNIPVTVEQEGLNTIDKIALSGPAGEGADVFMAAHDNFEMGLSSGVFLKLDDAVAKEVTDKVSDSGVETVTSEENLYGVPISIEVNCLFYNKDLIAAPADTLEEIMEQAADFNDASNNRFYFLCTMGDGYYEYPFVSSAGFQLFGENGEEEDNPGFDTDEYEKGLELLASMQEIMPISSTDLNNKSTLKATFMEGNAAYYVSGPWDVTQIKESGLNFGITVLPTYEGRALTPFAGVQCAYVSPYTDYPVAAQLLAAFLISDEGASILYKEYDSITTLEDISHVEGLSEDEFVIPFVEQFKNSIPMPSTSRISFYWSISQDIDQAVFDGEITPMEGREKAVENWNTLLSTE